MYVLTKISVDVGAYSRIAEGSTINGRNFYVKRIIDGQSEVVSLDTLNDMQIDDEVVVIRGLTDFIKTSPISEILEQTDKYIKFKTQTSVYELRELEDL